MKNFQGEAQTGEKEVAKKDGKKQMERGTYSNAQLKGAV